MFIQLQIQEIYNTISSQFGKSYVNDFNKYGRVYRVYMQADDYFRSKPSDMDKIFVRNQNGKMVPLTAVTTVKDIVGYDGRLNFNTNYPNGTPRKFLDSSKLMNLGWKPEISLYEGIEQTYKELLEKHWLFGCTSKNLPNM